MVAGGAVVQEKYFREAVLFNNLIMSIFPFLFAYNGRIFYI